MKDVWMHYIERLKKMPYAYKRKFSYYFHGVGDAIVAYWFVLFLLLGNKQNYIVMIMVLITLEVIYLLLRHALRSSGALIEENRSQRQLFFAKIVQISLYLFAVAVVVFKVWVIQTP